jgi:hypothetical protein
MSSGGERLAAKIEFILGAFPFLASPQAGSANDGAGSGIDQSSRLPPKAPRARNQRSAFGQHQSFSLLQAALDKIER